METNPYGMLALWTQGDIVIRTVAILLLAMSIASWTLIALRVSDALRLRRTAQAAHTLLQGNSVTAGLAPDQADPFRRLYDDGQRALAHYRQHCMGSVTPLPLTEWLTTCLRGSIDESAEHLQKGMSVLASVGATAPFVGLFGTVWGIYHALVRIGVTGQVGIDKVAGPVGEALIMTAFGLAVAVPAVLAYNAFSRSNKQLLGKLNRFAYQLNALLLTGAVLATRNSASSEGAR